VKPASQCAAEALGGSPDVIVVCGARTHGPVEWFQLGAQTRSVPMSMDGGQPAARLTMLPEISWWHNLGGARALCGDSSPWVQLCRSSDHGQVDRLSISSHSIVPMVLGDSGHLSSGAVVIVNDMLLMPMSTSLTTSPAVPVALVERGASNGAGNPTDGLNSIKLGPEAIVDSHAARPLSLFRQTYQHQQAIASQ